MPTRSCAPATCTSRPATAPDTVAFLERTFEEIEPLPVYLAPGNHDWYAPGSPYRQARWSPNVHVFTEDRLTAGAAADGLTLWGAAHRHPPEALGFLDQFRVDRAGVHLALLSRLGARRPAGRRGGAPAARAVRRGPDRAVGAPPCAGRSLPPPARRRAVHLPRQPRVPGLRRGWRARRRCPDRPARWPRRPRAAPGRDDRRPRPDPVASAAARASRRSAINWRCCSTDARGSGGSPITGELDPRIDLHVEDLTDVPHLLEGLQIRLGDVWPAYDLATIGAEQTVRGRFVRDVLNAALPEDERRRVLLVGLRALEGRADLGPLG